jgi:predicted phage-related endonuclease
MPDLTEAQHDLRRTRIGASEVGALLGPHPYTDPARIYARIVDGPEPAKDSRAMAAGHALERAIGDVAAAELGLRLRACSHTYIHPTLPLAASPDFYAAERSGEGGPGLLEVKLSREWSDWSDGPPPWYAWQVRAQLALTGRPWAYLAALVGTAMQTHRIERDLDLEAELLDAVSSFQVRHLAPRIPPETDREALVLRWTLGPGESVATGTLESVGDLYAITVRERRQAEENEKAVRAEFVAKLAGGTRLVVGQGWTAAVDERGSLRFNAKGRS